MATVPQKTLTWLWSVLQREYRDPPRIYNDLVQLLSTYPSFAPRTDVYTSENGVSSLLVHLNGTLPVNFRGVQYQFPLAIWLPHAYPYDTPILFVMPAPDMVVRPGQFVSHADGRIYHPYLARWRDAAGKSTVIELLTILADVFAREPPVMSRPQMPTALTSTSAMQQQGPPAPPRPPRSGEERASSVTSTSSPAPSASSVPPPPHEQNGTLSIADLQRQSRYNAPPPLPVQPQMPSRPQQVSSPFQAQRYEPQMSSNLRQTYPEPSLGTPPIIQTRVQNAIQPQPPQVPAQQLSQPQQLQASMQHTQQHYQPSTPHNYHPSQSFPSQQTHVRQQPAYVPQAMPQLQPPTTKPQTPNLLDESPFDISFSKSSSANLPKPELPPNPEKQQLLQTLSQALSQATKAEISQNESALPALQSQHSALQQAQLTLTSEIEQLKILQSHLQSNISALKSTLTAADSTIANARSKSHSIPKIDDLIIPPTVVARQLYDIVAEERACEAAIQALDEAFVRGKIGSEVWGRVMRGLGREEFRRKWMVKRVGTSMGISLDGL